MPFTSQQQAAINHRGGNLLLSAAAGSGKTTVLVERIAQLIIKDNAHLRDMLVMTFTRAAAADMRAKLSKKLMEEANKAEGEVRKRLKTEALTLESAMITTIDGFCGRFLHEYFEKAGVDPAYEVMDPMRAAAMFSASLDEVLEEAYAQPDEALLRLDAGRDPKKVREMVACLCQTMENAPDPDAWCAHICNDLEDMLPLWMDAAKREAKDKLSNVVLLLETASNVENAPPKSAAFVANEAEELRGLLSLDTCDELRRALEDFKFGRRPSERNLVDKGPNVRLGEYRDKAKKMHGEILGLLQYTSFRFQEDMRLQQPQREKLGQLATAVRACYLDKKLDALALEFSDVAHMTLKVLRENADVRAEMQRRYAYIFIDEYQDTSGIQEEMVQCISRGDNVFMVGDVKQSIYRFRNADPTLFMQKSEQYRHHEGGTLLTLSNNFRSTPNVLNFVNNVFERVMSPENERFTNIVYDEIHRLNPAPGREPKGEDPKMELHFVPEISVDGIKQNSYETQTMYLVQRIRELRKEDPTIRYSDIAILTRAKKDVFNHVLPILLKNGIPAYADGAAGVFAMEEMRWAEETLRLLNNRHNDEALLTVLYSPVIGLEVGELAALRVISPNTTYADAVRACVGGAGEGVVLPATRAKLKRFSELYEKWRSLVGSVSLGTLLRTVLEESGFYTFAGTMDKGAQRQANLDRFVHTAEKFDEEFSGSLTRFLEYVDLQKEKDDELANILGENDDVVRLMTVHKSKGLEFRVVFALGMQKGMGSSNATEVLSTDRELGIAFPLFDEKLRTKRTTLAQAAIKARNNREDDAERLRILYVLLTRAKERLLLFGEKIDEQLFERPYELALPMANGFFSVMIPALVSFAPEGESTCYKTVWHDVEDLPQLAEESSAPRDALADAVERAEALRDDSLEAALDWSYPNTTDGQKPLKLTVSTLLREMEGPLVLPKLSERPQFMQDMGGASALTGAERGTAYHRVMQLLDLAALRGVTAEALASCVENQIRDFRARRLLEDVQADAVQAKNVVRFLVSDIGRRLMAAETVHREWPFNVLLRAKEVLSAEEAGRFADEDIVVQGVVDCCFMEDGQWVLLDYKTNRTDNAEALRDMYGKQLGVYALAIERITAVPVKEKMLCMIGSGRTIPM